MILKVPSVFSLVSSEIDEVRYIKRENTVLKGSERSAERFQSCFMGILSLLISEKDKKKLDI